MTRSLPRHWQQKRPFSMALLGVLLLSACGKSAQAPVSPSAASPTGSTPAPSVSAAPSASPTPDLTSSTLISDKGIGPAQLGMKLSELKQLLGNKAEFTVQSPFIVDFDAIAVRQNGQVQYYILYLAGQSFTDNDVIQGLYTNNPRFKTAQAVGAGTLLQTAEEAYGKATLSYHTQNESREYARFANQPAANISFGTGNGNAEHAGVYPSPTGEYNETKQYRDGAKIQSVLVVCLKDGCAASSSPGAQ